mmetsp:Transcript_18666/g.23181  ORF Transcript_18666/g.23181 Transcript_18666/m.23181 type:complete len:253 (+) Transcript_18666:773-1531(+)
MAKNTIPQPQIHNQTQSHKRLCSLTRQHPLQFLAHPLPTNLDYQTLLHIRTHRRCPQIIRQTKLIPHPKTYSTQHPQRIIMESHMRTKWSLNQTPHEQIIQTPLGKILHTLLPHVVKQRINRKIPPQRVLQRTTKILHLRRYSGMFFINLLAPQMHKVHFDAVNFHRRRFQVLALVGVGAYDSHLVFLRRFDFVQFAFHDRGEVDARHTVYGDVDVVAVQVQDFVADPAPGDADLDGGCEGWGLGFFVLDRR